ncbi:unnamed protein product [Porites evermanni]|uniref:C2H2-type domain-containing protein n=1 Tax=Porites evermanni TaxID=104178 RepID=A0ABN8Q4P9_9CNID|nr:unnamed protein product [Porites evermanni]
MAERNVLYQRAIRTLIPSRIIKQYQSYCESVAFEPYSERTLFRILEAYSASKQVSSQGLDYIATESEEAFDQLKSIVNVLQDNGVDVTWANSIKQDLKAGKRYLKTDCKTHTGSKERCKDHCTTFSLSDPNNSYYSSSCNHEHEKIDEKLNDKNVPLTEEQRARSQYDHKRAINSILLWKAHLLRIVVQEKAKQDVITNLYKESTLLIMDWAMKFLPMKFRERMDDFYGRRGEKLTCSIKSASEDEDRVEVDTFVHIFDSCTQDWFSVASIVEHVLSVIRMEDPSITKFFLRSDNAGCYHNTELLLSLRAMGERHGVEFKPYDFSDPQSCKDVCDRRIASMKTHMRRWVNEGHGITTAEEMKIALESHEGVRGCRFAVVEIDKSTQNPQVKKTPGISFLNNFMFFDEGIRAWKAYQIGEGHFYPYSSLTTNAQGATAIKGLNPFSSPSNCSGASVAGHSSISPGLFFCEEEGCVKMFSTYKELQHHLDAERHLFVEEQYTAYDVIKKKWASILSNVNLQKQRTFPSMQAGYEGVLNCQEAVEGWPLKTVQKSSRMSEDVRNYLIQRSNDGAKTGNKADPKQVEHEMKHVRNTTGGLLFQPYEWRTSKQIASFFLKSLKVSACKEH